MQTVPEGHQWAHEIKLDGYRMHGRLERGQVKLLTRTGLDWSEKYSTTMKALKAISTQQAYIDRKQQLQRLLARVEGPIRYCDHQVGLGPRFYQSACKLGLEGIVSKRLDAPYVPGNRGLWLKIKSLNREEFIVIGWTDPEASRIRLGALLLAYYDPNGRLDGELCAVDENGITSDIISACRR